MSNKLINKSYKNYDYVSRYSSFPYYYNVDDKKYIYGTTSQIVKSIPYVIHKIKNDETLDSIALDYYNNPTYFWILADFNNIQDPYIKLKANDTLNVPAIGQVKFEVN